VSGNENLKIFTDFLNLSLETGAFLKATLSKSVPGFRWKRAVVSSYIASSGERQISFEYSDGRQVERKNLKNPEAFRALIDLIPTCFRSVYLRASHEELSFEATDRGSFRLKRKVLEGNAPTIQQHNREKNYLIPVSSPFLFELGITSETGVPRRDRHDKFRQIQKFIEVIDNLVPRDTITKSTSFNVVDFGSGKHYLTFALNHYLSNISPNISIVGIEQRDELVSIGQAIADKLGEQNLRFVADSIESAPLDKADLVVALHACDTATDDAIARAVISGARFICVAPCCHKYVRRSFQSSEDLLGILRHGILEERFAESLTDALRVLALESVGYQVKLFEFISLEHTAKNVMITAFKTGQHNLESQETIKRIKDKFSLKDFYLDRKLHPLSAILPPAC
jgi:hypothetical protein